MNNNLIEAYQKERHARRLKDVYTACLIALALVPAGLVLDYTQYKAFFTELFIIRTATVAALCLLFLLNIYPKAQKYATLNAFLWPIIINIAICHMMYTVHDMTSPYYAGLSLVVIGTATMLALNFREALFVLIATQLIYLFYIYIDRENIHSTTMIINNFYFLTLSGLIGVGMSYFGEKRRFKEFALGYELDSRNKELARLNQAKSDFFANISHEFRTPLTLILSPIEELLNSEQPLDFRVTRLLETVKSNSYRLLKLVNDVLSLVRLDDDTHQLKNQPVDLKPLLQSVVASMQHLAKRQKISLSMPTSFMPATISGDTDALEKIFINLLNNAIKFTPEGGQITVSNTLLDDKVCITIADTGIGINEQDIPHIFKRFQQADSSATRKYQGTGLGLALVHELTLAQKGEISVSSEINKGTVFTLSFPYADNTQTDPSAATTEAPGPANNPALPAAKKPENPLEKIHQNAEYSMHLNRPDATVLEPDTTAGNSQADQRPSLLIIEDEPELRSYLVLSLADEYRIISAKDGKAGLELALKHKPDLVLTDLMLPEIDGLEICATLKKQESLRFTKIVLLTARIDEKAKMTALENGANDFLTKPFSTTELHTRLRNLARAQQLEKTLEQHNRELKQALADLKAAESKLLHSEKLNAIGSLASGLLHEVNNPLNYTLTAAQILQRDPEIKADSDRAEMVDDIIEGMERIKAIVKDLHTFAYPEKADTQQSFVLHDAVTSALRFTAHEKGRVDINVDVPADIKVIGSNNHIVQVLINLITNALKAVADKNPGKIDISARQGDDQRILVKVRDNGTGIDEKTLSRIFEPFFTTRDIGEGLGMGLSICHTIIENHGGSLEVSSEVGKFTVFSFDLAPANNPGDL